LGPLLKLWKGKGDYENPHLQKRARTASAQKTFGGATGKTINPFGLESGIRKKKVGTSRGAEKGKGGKKKGKFS